MKTIEKTFFDWKFVLPIGSFYELQNRPYKVEYEFFEGNKRFVKVQGFENPISAVFFKEVKSVKSFKPPKVGESLLYYQGIRVFNSAPVKILKTYDRDGKIFYILKTSNEFISGEVR